MDYFGALASGGALTLLTIALSQRSIFSGESIVPYFVAALGVLLIVVLIVVERRARFNLCWHPSCTTPGRSCPPMLPSSWWESRLLLLWWPCLQPYRPRDNWFDIRADRGPVDRSWGDRVPEPVYDRGIPVPVCHSAGSADENGRCRRSGGTGSSRILSGSVGRQGSRQTENQGEECRSMSRRPREPANARCIAGLLNDRGSRHIIGARHRRRFERQINIPDPYPG